MSEWIVQQVEQEEAEERRYLDSLPKCEECLRPIQEDQLYDVHGTLFCEDCIEGFKKFVDGYIEESEW